MRFCANKFVSAVVLAAFLVAQNHLAYAQGRLRPQDFNKMYYLATQGKVGILREAVLRGLDIDSVNPNGDTGLCIAVKRKDYRAYNTFRMCGANPRHACTYRMYKEYQEFLTNGQAAQVNSVVGNEESLNYKGDRDYGWWPWILGGTAIGGGIWALTRHKSSGHKATASSSGGSKEEFNALGYGLAGYVTNYANKVSNGSVENTKTIDAGNPSAETSVKNISFLPNMLNNAQYLRVYAKVMENASYRNAERQADGSGGVLNLGDAAIALSAHGNNAEIENLGNINVTAKNGSIAMVASNGGRAFNSSLSKGVSPVNSSDGSINMIFRGNEEGDAVIGMYADTHSEITNYGKISGIASLPANSGDQTNNGWSGLFLDDNNSENDAEEQVIGANSGTILGMSLFDYYTGTDVSQKSVYATNHGNITLQAGHNNASNVAVSLIGMGSYLDDRFLNGVNNPFFAEKMWLFNDGLIDLAYQKTYNLASEALKLGNGGLIGMRADASTSATNQGTINIDMQATTISHNNDVAAGMLSVHGASLVNGAAGSAYKGTTDEVTHRTTYQDTDDVTGGTIRLTNEATSGGVFYGMLAAKGSGTQTNIYKWQPPTVTNHGLIDMRVSNSYAMASFAGGEVINNGVINLGQENGQSYYTNNRGLYAAGQDVTEEVSLINNGVVNVYSEESAAIENAFSGSVSLINNGGIYISNKATNSKAFAGNYSKAANYRDILYKVGNSAAFVFPEGAVSDIGFNVKTSPVASVITSSAASNNGNVTKQYVLNGQYEDEATGATKDATLVIGEKRINGVDYGGTFGTAGIQVSKQGSADNEGLISLILFDEDISQFNSAMWLDDTTTAESYADNYGTIAVYAANSIGMRNDSKGNASATNYGTINVDGTWDYGMAATQVGANIFNGRYDYNKSIIDVSGYGAIGMYIKNGNGYNYGEIRLSGNYATAVQLDGENAYFVNKGEIVRTQDPFVSLKGVVYYWTTNGAMVVFTPNSDAYGGITAPELIDGFTLGKATTDQSAGFAYLSAVSTVTATGEDSYVLVASGPNSTVGSSSRITVKEGATGMKASNGAIAFHEGYMIVKDVGSVGIRGIGRDTGTQTKIDLSIRSNIEVKNGMGVYGSNFAEATNGGDISVSGGIGMYVTDGNAKQWTKGQNDGAISVNHSNAIGVAAVDGAQFTNYGRITAVADGDLANIDNYARGIYSNSKVYNEGEEASINVGRSAIGVDGGTFMNNGGYISVNGKNSYGTYGADVKNNSGTISASGVGAIGVNGGSLDNNATVSVSGGAKGAVSNVQNSGTIEVSGYGISGEDKIYSVGVEGNIVNKGKISVYGGYGVVGSGTNSGTITNQGGIAAVKVNEGDIFRNSGTIDGNGVGVEVAGGSFINTNDIDMTSGTGVSVYSGYAENDGTINIGSDSGMIIGDGVYDAQNKQDAEGVNNGVINLATWGYGVEIKRDGIFTNNGTINFDSSKFGSCYDNSGTCLYEGNCVDSTPPPTPAPDPSDGGGVSPTAVSSPLLLASNATFINNGVVNLDGVEMDLSEGNYVLGKDGTYQAASFKGDILASTDIVKDGFEDTYTAENAFTGENKGLTATSQSYLFDAEIEDKDETSDIKLTRKGFNDLVEEQDLANFFETNYQLQHNEKMYQSIKSAATQTELNEIVENESGKKFYANLPRENMAVLRGIQHGEQQRILEDGLNGATVGANYFRTGKDGNGGLSDYADDVYSATLGYGGRLNRNWSMGGALTAAYADAKYDDIHSKRNNTVIMAFMPILYQNNRFKYLAMPSIGVGFGEYERHATSGNYKADTFDLYYGLYNHAEYSIDMKVAELVAEAELNLQGVNSDTAKEKGGLNLESNDSVSLEAGVGLKLRKRIQLAKQRELMLAVGTKYYHEMLDPYKSLSIGMKDSPVNYKLKGYDEDKNRLRTAAEAMYKDGRFAVSAEIAHNAEKESNVEGGLGVRYNF